MNLESLKDKLADAEAEAARAAQAFKTAPDTKTLSAKEVTAQLAANAKDTLAAAEQKARDAERAVKLEQLAKLKRQATVPALVQACADDVAAIVKAEQLIRDAVARLAVRVN